MTVKQQNFTTFVPLYAAIEQPAQLENKKQVSGRKINLLQLIIVVRNYWIRSF